MIYSKQSNLSQSNGLRNSLRNGLSNKKASLKMVKCRNSKPKKSKSCMWCEQKCSFNKS